MKSFYKNIGLGALAGLALAGCKKDLDTYYTPQDAAGGYEVLVTTPALATKYAPGETIAVSSGYNAGDNPTAIAVFQATKADSAQVGSYPVNSTLPVNTTNGLTVQSVPYVVPTTYAIGTRVRVDVILNFQNGGRRVRSFAYQVANSPTLVFGSPAATYRNGLSVTA